MSDNSFDARATLRAGGREVEVFRLDALQSSYDVARLPYTLRVLDLDPNQQQEVRRRKENGEAIRAIARSYNVHNSTIARIVA